MLKYITDGFDCNLNEIWWKNQKQNVLGVSLVWAEEAKQDYYL